MGKGIIARTMADLLAQAKDPAEAARIQRAIDSGRNKILYHGTHTDFPAVDPSKVDLGLHLGTSEQATNRLTDLAKAKRGTNRYNDGAQILPAAVRLGNSLEMRDVGGWGDVGQLGLVLREHPELQARQSEIDELLDSADYLRSQFVAANRHMDDPSAAWVLSDDNKQILSDMRDLLTSDGYDSIKYHNEVENTDGVRGGLLEEYQQEAADIDARMREIKQAAIQRRPPPPDMNDPNLEASMQEFLARSPVLENYMTPEEKDLIQKYGSRHHDLRMNEQYRNDPYSYIVLKPENLRSINAQFDPEFDLSPDLMKAEGGLVGLAEKYANGGAVQKFGKGQLFRTIQGGLSDAADGVVLNNANTHSAPIAIESAGIFDSFSDPVTFRLTDEQSTGVEFQAKTFADFNRALADARAKWANDFVSKIPEHQTAKRQMAERYASKAPLAVHMSAPAGPHAELKNPFVRTGRIASGGAGLGESKSLWEKQILEASKLMKFDSMLSTIKDGVNAARRPSLRIIKAEPQSATPDSPVIIGTYDPLDPDITKRDGGLVELAHKYNKGGLIQKYQKGNLVRQWLKGYPEKSLAPLKRADVEKPEVAALNNWIDTSLAKYIKRDYGSPNDPLALLAPEQRHVPLLDEGRMRDSQTNAVWPPRRPTGDIGLSGVSSDTLDWLTNPSGRPKAYIDQVMAENPWLASLPKETILYGDVRIHDLGLQRLRDGLHNAMRPDSDLPDMLRLKPESLPRVSVAQASQLVGKINAWRAAESAKAELAASMNPATFIHKEYPEKNMRWVEIKPKDKLTKLPEGYSIGPSNDMSRQSGQYVLHYPLGDEAPLGSYATEEEALEKALKVIGKDDDGGYQSIRDAMKYESDQMHHCLGDPDQGYCDDVFDGMSRVFSLRDKRGAPHVTIETSGPKSNYMLDDDTIDEVAPGTLDDYLEQRTQRGGYRNLHNYVRNVRPDVYEELTRPEIRQIKGHGDRMPVDRYLPFVQDFVRSQKWANIGDLHHTGLRQAAEAFQPYSITKARAEGIDLPDYLTEQEIADITAKLQATNKPNGMKEGGMARPDVRDNPDNESYEESKRRKKTGVSMIDSLLDPMYAIRAGIRAQYRPSDVVWTDEDGNKHSYTAPGLANSTVGLGMFMPGDNPMSDAAMAAYTSGLNYENEMGGLPASEDMGKYTHFGNTLGEVLGQLPIGAAGISKGILSKAAMAIPDYLGPFMRPSVGNYASAALAGEALPHMIGGMMSLAERYGLGSDVPIDADESDRLLASLGIESAGRKIDNAGIDRYIAESEAREAARDRIAANVYGSLPRYGKGQLFKTVEKAVKGNGRSTIKGAERKAYPGIYRDPKELVTEASLQIPSESPALQQLFGVNRRDLADMALAREATEWLPPGAPSRGRGSAHAAPVMHDANTERLVNALNAAKGTDLGIGMQGWYMMDPAYQRLEVLYGPDEAKMMYDKFNTLTGIHSANSSVLTELNRGSAANWLDSEGRLGDYINYGGSMGVEGRPDDMAGVVGHMAHKTAHLLPAIRYLSSGVLSKEAKTPSYIAASQLPGMGNNVNFPVGDAHFSRAIGLADTRPGDTSDIYGKSWSMPEAMQLHEWFTKDVAGEAGMQGVPAQATLWGVYAPQTGVKTAIGVPKLELLADMIMKTAKRLDVSPERARDLVLSGRAHAGFVDPELLGLMGLGGVGAAAAIGMKGDEDAKAMGGLVDKYGALTE